LLAAIEMFPHLAPAHAAYADLVSWEILNGLSDDIPASAKLARDEASTALDKDHDSPYVLSRCGMVFMRLNDRSRGIDLCERAFELAPSTTSKEALARAYCYAGRSEEAIGLLMDILAMLPRGHAFRYGKLVVPLVQAGRISEALKYSFLHLGNFPKDYYAWALHCNIVFQLLRPEEALEAWAEVQALAPKLTIEQIAEGTIRTYGRTEQQKSFLTDGLQGLRVLMEKGEV